MKALLKTGNWVEIDTNCLFNNQYNTTKEFGNKRIFDGDIIKIKDDARIGKGKCKYCGKIVKKGEENEHFKSQEENKEKCSMKNTDLKTCFWKSKKYLGERETNIETKTSIENGVEKTVEIRTVKQKWEPYCLHKEKYGNCTYDECRRHGIEWFTEENCFFIKYPNGFEDFNLSDWAKGSWVRIGNTKTFANVSYSKSLRSYSLRMELNENETKVKRFYLSNANNRFSFLYKNGEYILFDGIHSSPRVVKELLGDRYKCNAAINEAVKNAIEQIIKREINNAS